ncbi:MAG: serine/threonine protein kinase, partial [Planctomycetota bacterium]
MTPEQMQRAYELFEQALQRPPEERSGFLAEACGNDAELRAEVESLLEQDSRVPDDFMQPPESEPRLTGSISEISYDPLIDTRVGSFHIKRVIASGGMGTVYEAVQDRPHRTVALKIIKLGMDTREVVGRFESEREALAMMNHSSIAQVFDAGATEQGRPYFVMEYVPGVPITEHCDRHKLDIEQRLKLFTQVCDAVQHAHQKGIIHRDLKPSNILVAYEGQQAVPKIIDLGVAKALNRRLSERTIFTEQGQLIGTPEYMSPEQAEMSGQDIDTRADVYSLGVLLYELLTGSLPFDPKTLRRAGFAEIQRIIREVEPPKPSTKLASLFTTATPTGTDLAARRRSEPKTLLRRLRGDLDWIVMRCLDKDRVRRYETADALAMEVRRYLNHEPVSAGPPSAAYRVRKFARRNRGPVVAAGLLTLALLAGLIGTTTFALREAHQRKLAEESEQEARDNEAIALRRADETRRVAEFQAKMLKGIDAQTMGQMILQELRNDVRAGLERTRFVGDDGRMRKRTADEVAAALTEFDASVAPANPADVARQVLVVTMLAPAVSAISEQFGDQPAVQGYLLDELGVIHASLGQYDLAEPLMRQGLNLQRRLYGNEHPGVATSLNNLATLLHEKGEYAAAEPLYREALALRRKMLGDEHPHVATSMTTLGWILYLKGDYAAAEPLYREALAMRRKLLGEDHPDVATSLNNLAMLQNAKGDRAEAEQLYRKALALRRRALGDEHPRVAVSLHNLAALLTGKGDYSAAEPMYREALAMFRKLLGNEHP